MAQQTKAMLDELRKAEMDSPQPEVVASHIPDWSQAAEAAIRPAATSAMTIPPAYRQ